MNNNPKTLVAKSWPCEKDRLTNEASVETFFINRFLEFLQWDDSKVRLKESIQTFLVGEGRRKIHYKPDYILLDDNGSPYIVIDAKGTNEKIQEYVYQCAGYSLMLNQERESVKYFILSSNFFFFLGRAFERNIGLVKKFFQVFHTIL